MSGKAGARFRIDIEYRAGARGFQRFNFVIEFCDGSDAAAEG